MEKLQSIVWKLIQIKPFHAHRILKNRYPRIWNQICNKTQDGHADATSTETLYRFVTGNSRAACVTCGQKCPFLSYNKGYQRHCSNSCGQLDTATVCKKEHTSILRYGVPKTIIRNQPIMQQTRLEKYGTKHFSTTALYKQKTYDTNMRKRGVGHHMQSVEGFQTSQKAQFKRKEFILPNGDVLYCQGYEPMMLTTLVKANILDIHTEISSIPYKWEEKARRYFPDIYVPSLNLMIEVKSVYYFMRDLDLNLCKQQATLDAGYNHFIAVFDKSGNLVQLIGSVPTVLDMRVDNPRSNE